MSCDLIWHCQKQWKLKRSQKLRVIHSCYVTTRIQRRQVKEIVKVNLRKKMDGTIIVLQNCHLEGQGKYRLWCQDPPKVVPPPADPAPGTNLAGTWLGSLASWDYSLHKHFHLLKSSFCGVQINFPPSFVTRGTPLWSEFQEMQHLQGVCS